MIRIFCYIVLLTASVAAYAEKPNIVYILADDLGYGDIASLNPDGKIPTPHIDSLGKDGMTFTNAHSTSAVCTPTRYSVLTGRYNWRSTLEQGVAWSYSPHLIQHDRVTVAELLKRQGYATACIGKWHLGLDWTLKNGGLAARGADSNTIDFTKPVGNGPLVHGFDEFFGITASLDIPPFVYIEGDELIGIPTVTKHFYRDGIAEKDFEALDVLPELTRRAGNYIDHHANAAKNGEPFFLYFPLTAPHTPIVPTDEWAGKSNVNGYADFVMQVDHTVGEVLAALERNGLSENTLVIFTSDNGCSPEANFRELADKGHDPSYVFRGHKADIFEGGHRVPFFAKWPGHIKKNSKTDAPVSLGDLMATTADILDVALTPEEAVDSVSMVPLFNRKEKTHERTDVVHHSINGSFAITEGDWKLALCPGSGGWSNPRPGRADLSELPAVQLYNLKDDIGESNNLAGVYPNVVARLTSKLEHYVARGRSTPGPDQTNDRDVDIFKAGRQALQSGKK
ncbi:MAG: arylsulfatase [Candidatus Hydrogenedentota bacterium]